MTGHGVRYALDYIHHTERMRYPEFAAHALPLGSGLVESAVKLVAAARQKGSGMRWSQGGAQSVGTLRALLRSGRWAAFWSSQPSGAARMSEPWATPGSGPPATIARRAPCPRWA